MAKTETAELQPIDIPSPFGLDLDVAAKLGARADGVEIAMLKRPADLVGVPEEIPVALRRGATPGVASLHELFDHYRLHPATKRGTAEVETLDSFCDLVDRHSTADSGIFADTDWQKPSFTAVIDYHEAKNGGIAGFGRHRIHYAFPLSEEWQAWMKMNGEAMKQEQFAWFLEDRVAELAAPTDVERNLYESQFATTFATPAQVVELSRGLKLTIDTQVKNHVTLQSGEGQIAWEETHNGADGKPIRVHGLFMLSISPFFMGEKVRIPVRLRYRSVERKIVWFYQVYRPDLFITEHVRHALFDAKERTGLPAYEGKPEMQA